MLNQNVTWTTTDISQAATFKRLRKIRAELTASNQLTSGAAAAIETRAYELGRDTFYRLFKFPREALAPPESEAIEVISKTIGEAYLDGHPPFGLMRMIRNRGLTGTVKACVERRRPTSMFEIFERKGKLNLAFETLVLKFPDFDGFTDRTVACARRNLGLQHFSSKPHSKRLAAVG